MITGETDTDVFRLLVSSIVIVSLCFAGPLPAPAQAQDSSPPSSYYGNAVTEDGLGLSPGTEIKAVVSATGEVVGNITIETAGEYGGSGLGDKKLAVDSSIDREIQFVVERGGERFVANFTDPDPSSGTQRADLEFPPGAAGSRPYFDVSGLQPGETTAIEGTTVTVNATVENIGTEQDTQTISLDVSGSTVESDTVTLGPDSQQTVNFAIDTETLGPGEYSYTVASADTSQSSSLTVDSSQTVFSVSGLDPSDTTVLTGERVNVSGTVRNDGNSAGTQTLELRAGDTVLSSTDVTLDPGEERAVDFTDVSTESLATGTYTHGIFSANDSATGTLTVEARLADFSVTGLNPADATATVGDELTVSATVRNDGNSEGTQTVTLSIDGTEHGSEQLTLGVDTEESVTFAPFNTSALGPGTYSYEVASENDTQSGTLIVESDSPATFTVTDLTPAEATVRTDGTLDVSAAVTNDGAAQATQRIRMQVDGDTVARRSVTLGGGATTTVSFSDVGTGGLGAGTYSYGVFSNDDSATGTLTVEGDSGSEPTATFTLSALEPATTTVSQGDRVTVTTTVSNDGDAEGTQTVVLDRNSQQVDSADVSLAAGQDRTVSLSFDTAGLANGSHVYSISTDDDRQVGTLTVTTDSEATPTPTDTGTPTPEPPDGTSTAIENTTTTTATESGTESTTTASGDDGGLLPGGLLGTVLLWVGVPLLVIYGILKALALYLGY